MADRAGEEKQEEAGAERGGQEHQVAKPRVKKGPNLQNLGLATGGTEAPGGEDGAQGLCAPGAGEAEAEVAGAGGAVSFKDQMQTLRGKFRARVEDEGVVPPTAAPLGDSEFVDNAPRPQTHETQSAPEGLLSSGHGASAAGAQAGDTSRGEGASGGAGAGGAASGNVDLELAPGGIPSPMGFPLLDVDAITQQEQERRRQEEQGQQRREGHAPARAPVAPAERREDMVESNP
ncbi:hypothetical protein T484DRAFT_1917561, partial [Baffinella frigidus]